MANVASPQCKENLRASDDPQVGRHAGQSPCRRQSTGEPLESVAALKRKREDGQSSREERLKEWLHGLDDGGGMLLQYYDILSTEFEADLAQIAAVKNAPPSGNEPPRSLLDMVDPIFWEIVQVRKMGH